MFKNQTKEPVVVQGLLKKNKFARFPVPGNDPGQLPGDSVRRVAIHMQDLHGIPLKRNDSLLVPQEFTDFRKAEMGEAVFFGIGQVVAEPPALHFFQETQVVAEGFVRANLLVQDHVTYLMVLEETP
jgi:hypothetical protein